MKQLSRLRTLANKVNAPPDDVRENVNRGGKVEVSLPAPNKGLSTTKSSLFLEHVESEDDERGCLEAVTAFLAAIAADKDGKRPAGEPGASPALLQTSKGARTIECRDSARELLRFFGHAPLLHLEGVIWVKTTGERGVMLLLFIHVL